MDKRKLKLKSSLHKQLQSTSQSLIRSDSDEQMSSRTNSVVTQEKMNTSNDERVSNFVSSILRPQNTQSSVKSNPVDKGKKRNFCEIEEGVLEKDDCPISCKLLKNVTLSSKRSSNQILIGHKFLTSQQENEPSTSGISKPSNSTNLSVKKSSAQKRKVADTSLVDSDSDLDVLSNECTVRKKKCDETALNTNRWNVRNDDNDINDSPRKVLSLRHKSPVKPITKSNISQKKAKVKPKELHSHVASERHRDDNKRHSPKKSIVNIPSALSTLLQKCGIKLSTDGTHVLSKTCILFYSIEN